MAEVQGNATTTAPRDRVWALLLSVDAWVGDLDGYAGHELAPDGTIVVALRGTVGFMTKRSRLRITIVGQEPPARVRFALSGIDDPLAGDGELVSRPAPGGGTEVSYRVALSAGGLAAPVLDQFLERAVPAALGNVAERIVERLEGRGAAEAGRPPAPTGAAGPSGGRRLLARLHSERFDVVVVGSGGAGLTAAITAHDLGARVVVLEKSDYVGGTFAYSSGLTWVPNNHRMRAEGVSDSTEDALLYIRPRTADRHDEAVLQAFLDHAPRVVERLDGLGVPFAIVPGYPDEQAEAPGGRAHGRYLSSPLLRAAAELGEAWRARLVHAPNYGGLPVSWQEIQGWGGFGSIGTWDWEMIGARLREDVRAFGMSTAGYLLRAAVQRGVPIRTGVAATHLVRRRGRVVGVRTSGPDGDRELSARCGVLLATGSYDNDRETKRLLEPHPETITLGAPTVDGSGLVMALELGARFALFGGQLLAPAFHVVGEEADGRRFYRLLVREPGFPGSVIVNRAGRRFCDESTITELRRALAVLDPDSHTHPNFPAYLIFDRRWKERYPLGSLMPGEVPDWLAAGASATELARRLEIDGPALTATLERFNDHAGDGRDPDFRRGETAFSRANGDPEVTPNPCVRPLEPPLYGIELRLGVVGNHGGLVVDSYARVMHVRGRPIAGLYAAGNAAANQIGGLWYNAGLMNARGMTFGSLAAEHALGAA